MSRKYFKEPISARCALRWKYVLGEKTKHIACAKIRDFPFFNNNERCAVNEPRLL